MDSWKLPLERLLELDRRIRAKEYPNSLNFSKDMEVSQKTAKRDFTFLRDRLGAPLEFDRQRNGYYYTEDRWFLPALVMTEGDLFSLLIASRSLEQYRGTPVAEQLEKVFAHIAQFLPEEISIKPELIFSGFTFTSPPARKIDQKIWVELVRGLTHKRTITGTYKSRNKPAQPLTFDPYHIANLRGDWYVFGWWHERKAIRQLLIAAFQRAKMTKREFEVREEFDWEKRLQHTFGKFAEDKGTQKVRILFKKEIAGLIEERPWHPNQKLKKRKNGDIELSFETSGLQEVFSWILSWGSKAKVLAPKELKDRVREEVKAMSKNG